jgi:hypothetical protein
MTVAQPLQARYGAVHNLSLAALAIGMVGAALLHFARDRGSAPTLSLGDPRFVLFSVLGVAMIFYAWLGVTRFLNRAPQVVIDRDGIALGFGRNRRFAWAEVEWVRLHRLALRPQLQIGLLPEAFAAADLKLTQWNLDDALRPVRGMPAALVVRDNGLDTRATAMLDAIRAFRPNLVKP